MIRKVALVQALRECYPQQFNGLYDRSEMDQAIVEPGKTESKEEIVETELVQPVPVVQESNFKTIPVIEDPEVELNFVYAGDYEQDLIDIATSQEHVFPPNDISRLHEVASEEFPFMFVIRDTAFGVGFQWTHFRYPKKDSEGNVLEKQDYSYDYLKIQISQDEFITLLIDNKKGELRPTTRTKEFFGPDLKPYMKNLGYGVNWWIVEKKVYDKLHADK